MAATSYLELLRESSLHPLAGVTGLVPNTRAINTTGPLTGGGTLNSDLTLGVNVTPGLSTVLVGQGRTITGVGAVEIDGVAAGSGDFSANRTIGVATFAGFGGGLVPGTSGGNAGKFLNGAGAWVTGTVAGVNSLTTSPPFHTTPDAGPAAIGDLTLDADLANIATKGFVPPTGGVDPTKVLIATNPISWAVPGVGAFVRLQAATPGSADVGHFNVSGTGIVGKLAANTLSPQATAHINSDLSTKEAMISRHQAASAGPGLVFRRSRGTEASPAVCNDLDELGGIVLDTRLTSSWLGRTLLYAYADGAGGASQSYFWDMYAGPLSSFLQMRAYGSGLRVETNRSSVNTTRVKSSLEVLGSLGLKLEFKTANFTAGQHSCLYYIDGSGVANPLVVTLPDCTAGGPSGTNIANRVYGFIKVEPSYRKVTIVPHTGQKINGFDGWELNAHGEAALIVSDGSNWFLLQQAPATGVVSAAAGSAVANTVAETALLQTAQPWAAFMSGFASVLKATGKFSTTGAPTMRFRVYDTNDMLIADSGAITLPTTVTSAAWQLEVAISQRDLTSAYAKVARAIVQISQAAGLGAEMKTYNMYDVAVPGMLDAAPYKVTATWGTADPANTITCLHSQQQNTRLNLVG